MSPASTSSPVPLVGRDRELAVIDETLAVLSAGGPQLLDILGEPGIGKTTLLTELRSRAEDLGARVDAGAAQEFEQEVPFALIGDALGPAVEAIDPRDLSRLGADVRDELASIFPGLASSERPGAPRPNERYRLHRAVRDLIERLAAAQPVVLILDDLHWADPASAELVSSLVRSPPRGPVLIAIGRRSTSLMPTLQVALDLGVLGEAGDRLVPGPLSLHDAQSLLPPSLPANRRTALFEQSGGNPFYLDGLSRNASRAGSTWGGARDFDDVPASIAAVVREELLPLTPDATLLLRAAAVVGGPFDIALATATAPLEQPAAFVAIDELVAADLVRPATTPRSFTIRHPLLRNAVYEAAPAGWRIGAHSRAAAALAGTGAPASASAHHVEHCALPGDGEATDLLAAAAREVASRAPATAARWLASAVRLADGGSEGGAAKRAALVPQLTMALVAAGRLDEAYASALEILATLSPGDPGYVQAVGFCAAIERMLGRFDDARARLGAALEALPEGDIASAVSLRLELAADASLAADFELMRSSAAATLADARQVGDAPAVACATAALSFAEYSNGRFAEATALCEQAAELVAALSDEQLATRLETILHLGWAEWFMGRFDLARALFDRGLLVARSTGGAGLVIELSVGSIVTLAGNGLLEKAVDLADGTTEEARLMGNGHTQVWAFFAQCMALEPVADPKRAVEVGEQAVAVARRFEGSTIAAACGWVSASALVAAGEGPRAVEVMLELQGGPDLPYFFPAHRATC
ncbi:MAG: AAA family ATPase, partial [Solirubrobacteraceae bacterium]|nr:AAA family ATPase [Solirubrobacteraceae bacterium]